MRGKITGNGEYRCYKAVHFSYAVSQLLPGICRQQVLEEWSFYTVTIIPLPLKPQHAALWDLDGSVNICIQDSIPRGAFSKPAGFLAKVVISEVLNALGAGGG